jgi:hypothetical protein
MTVKTFDELLAASSVSTPEVRRRALAAFVKRVLEPLWERDPWTRVVMGAGTLPALCDVRTPATTMVPRAFDVVVTFPREYIDAVKTPVMDMIKAGKPVAVENPAFEQWAVREVAITGVSTAERAPEPGCVRFTIKCVEYIRRAR